MRADILKNNVYQQNIINVQTNEKLFFILGWLQSIVIYNRPVSLKEIYAILIMLIYYFNINVLIVREEELDTKYLNYKAWCQKLEKRNSDKILQQ